MRHKNGPILNGQGGNPSSAILGSFVGGLGGGFMIDAVGFSPYYLVSAVPACFALVLLFTHWRAVAAPARMEPVRI